MEMYCHDCCQRTDHVIDVNDKRTRVACTRCPSVTWIWQGLLDHINNIKRIDKAVQSRHVEWEDWRKTLNRPMKWSMKNDEMPDRKNGEMNAIQMYYRRYPHGFSPKTPFLSPPVVKDTWPDELPYVL